MTPDLAVVIVTWNVRDLALHAIASLYTDLAHSGLSAQVVVVDSASGDDSAAVIAERFPQTHVIPLGENIGFGAANNVGLRAIGFRPGAPPDTLPRAVYLLNPDTLTQPGATRALFDALLADPALGLVGPRLSYGDGTFQHSAFAFPGLRQLYAEFFWVPGRWREGRFNGRYPRHLYQGSQPFPVDVVLGAAMMLRREAVLQTGGFDEGYFMYAEEVDWAWRLRQAGWRAACVPTAHVVHLGGQSTGQVRPASVLHLWRSRLRLARQHYPRWKRWLARRLIRVGLRRQLTALPSTPANAPLADAYRTLMQEVSLP